MLVVVGTEEGSAGDRALQQRSAFGYLTAFFQRYVRGDQSHDVYLAGQFLPEGLDDLHISLEHET